jgi:hypothetical protein
MIESVLNSILQQPILISAIISKPLMYEPPTWQNDDLL